METKRKAWTRQHSRHFIQYLNIAFLVSGRVMAVTAAGFSLLILFKQLFLVRNQTAWGTAMQVAFVVALVNLFLSIPVFVCAVKMKCNIPTIKGIAKYLMVEYITIRVLMLLTPLFFSIHTGGKGLTTWQGDHWWVVAQKTAWLISWFTGWTSLFQVFMWGPGSKGRDAGKFSP